MSYIMDIKNLSWDEHAAYNEAFDLHRMCCFQLDSIADRHYVSRKLVYTLFAKLATDEVSSVEEENEFNEDEPGERN